jgi:hypothetical protein
LASTQVVDRPERRGRTTANGVTTNNNCVPTLFTAAIPISFSLKFRAHKSTADAESQSSVIGPGNSS